MNSNFAEFYNEPNDNRYWQWMDENPNGFVVNPKRNAKSKDFKYHRVGCNHIADKSPHFTYTTNRKRKICSNNLQDLQNKITQGTLVPCSSCNP